MTGPTTVASATRRLFALTVLRWLPVGLLTPVLVLLALERGLTLTQIGLVFVVHSAVVVLLELPTGGLADALGRRPVLVASGVLHLGSCLLLLVAQDLTGFLLVSVVKGMGRALDSGPLEAWFVDTVHRLDPRADITPGLSWHSAADGGGLALGAVAGGLLPGLVGGSLLVPVAVAAALDVLYVVALLPLVHEPPREGSAQRALRDGLRAVPATVGSAVRLAVSDGPLRLVLVLTALGGVGIAALELLGPVRFAELAGSSTEGAAVFGVVVAVAYGAAGLGALAAPRSRRLARGSTRVACAVLTAVGALGVAAVPGAPSALLVGVAFSVPYVAHGMTWPLLTTVSHSRVTAAHRSTTVSAVSLAMALGGIAGSLVLPALADVTSPSAAFAITAGVLLIAAVLCLGLPRDEEPLRDERLHDGQHLLGGLPLAEAGTGGEHAHEVAEPLGAVAAGEQGRPVGVDAAGPAQP